MLDRVRREVDRLEPGPIALIGSSLGAVVAIHAAARLRERIDRLVLLAPAVMFAKDGHRFLGPERVAAWRTSGTLDVFHFADGGMRPLGYSFYEDSLQYDAFAAVLRQPALVFQGLRDDAKAVCRFLASPAEPVDFCAQRRESISLVAAQVRDPAELRH